MKHRTNNININEYIAQAEAPTRFQAEINELNKATAELHIANENFKQVKEGSEQAVNTICKAIATAHSSPVPVTIKAASLTKLETFQSNLLNSEREILTTHEQRIKDIITKQEQNLDRIHLPTTFFYIIIITLAMLLMGFGIIATLNATQIQSSTLTTYLWTITLATATINTLTITTLHCLRRKE